MSTKFNLKNLLKKNFNDSFSSKFMLQYGLHLGGHIHLLNIETSSIIFGIRTCNIIINLNFTALELVNIFKIIKNLGYKRCIIYFINSSMSFRLSFKYSFKEYNRHLFFPINFKIKNVLKKFKLFLLKKVCFTQINFFNIRTRLKKKRRFFLKSGKALLRKIFISSKWAYGFISNSSSFFNFTRNVFYEKVKFGKSINSFKDKLKKFFDFYPFLPNYGFIGDHKTNYWIVNEFKTSQVPTSSVIDTFTEKALCSMYGIPGNACSIDSTLFFLILTISNYLLGFYQQILSFCLDKYLVKEDLEKKFFKIKKKIFFKNFKLLCLNR